MTQIETNNEIEDKKSLNFIEQIVEADLKAGKARNSESSTQERVTQYSVRLL